MLLSLELIFFSVSGLPSLFWVRPLLLQATISKQQTTEQKTIVFILQNFAKAMPEQRRNYFRVKIVQLKQIEDFFARSFRSEVNIPFKRLSNIPHQGNLFFQIGR